ncbi:MAG TPA: RagB/SusD family nutrient uptake outer membrane protein [Puia sp.]|nr:RagB/SusD family nutrient uptake outer membrane protein [Puia sp.]
MRQHIFILAMVAVSIASCKKDFLTQYPQGSINVGNFYKTTNDFQEALTGAYGPLRDAANNGFYIEEMRSDNSYYTYNPKDRGSIAYEHIADFLDDVSDGVPGTTWIAGFNGINRCNMILDQLRTAGTAVPDSIKNEITGETKALRAHYYFELVRLFGKLPLYLHATTDNSSAFIGRSSVDSVYSQIIADFNDAIGLLPLPAFGSGGTQSGHVTRGMAATELGVVYLTLRQWDKATPLFQSVTQMGYSLLTNYADVFTTAGKNSRESIFEVQYKAGTDGQSSPFIFRFIPATPHTLNILGVDYNTSNSNYGGWNVPTQDIINDYEAGDKRLDASIAVVKGHLDANADYQPDSVASILSPATPGEQSRNFIRKYFHPPYNLQNNTDQDWYWYRYSDVLLMLAESLNEQGQSSAALPYLNLVRQRAGLAPSTETDQTALRAIIYHERRVELAFENHRWFDLVRTGQAGAVMNAYGVTQKQTYGYLLSSAYTVTDDRLIYAVPYRETQVNPGLGQNPGY